MSVKQGKPLEPCGFIRATSALVRPFSLAGRNTTEGPGGDLKSAGRVIERAADANKWPQHRPPG